MYSGCLAIDRLSAVGEGKNSFHPVDPVELLSASLGKP